MRLFLAWWWKLFDLGVGLSSLLDFFFFFLVFGDIPDNGCDGMEWLAAPWMTTEGREKLARNG